MKRREFRARNLLLCDSSDVGRIVNDGTLDGLSIPAIDLLSKALRSGALFPGLLIGFQEGRWRTNTLEFHYYLESNVALRRVNIEACTCDACGLDVLGCNVRMYDLYVDAEDVASEWEGALGLPFLSCPRCKSAMPRKYFGIYAEEFGLSLAE